MVNGRRVLLVDGLAETETVLKAVLEPRGHQVDRIRGDQRGKTLPINASPNVLVIHEDETSGDQARLEKWSRIPRVVIGSARVAEPSSGNLQQQYLQKPFQYSELIQAIERLLEQRMD